MDISTSACDTIEPVLTLSELASCLTVSVQTLYDLRSKGQGPRGFVVPTEVEAATILYAVEREVSRRAFFG